MSLYGNADRPGTGEPIDNAASSISKIDCIKIKGVVAGTGIAGDHFGFVAHQIGSFKCLGLTAPLTDGAPFEYSLTTGDVTIREV